MQQGRERLLSFRIVPKETLSFSSKMFLPSHSMPLGFYKKPQHALAIKTRLLTVKLNLIACQENLICICFSRNKRYSVW